MVERKDGQQESAWRTQSSAKGFTNENAGDASVFERLLERVEAGAAGSQAIAGVA
jgi:hypothetical protein